VFFGSKRGINEESTKLNFYKTKITVFKPLNKIILKFSRKSMKCTKSFKISSIDGEEYFLESQNSKKRQHQKRELRFGIQRFMDLSKASRKILRVPPLSVWFIEEKLEYDYK
jgi:hypothetical protein